ncbi:DNA-directed DNA polymerase II small subunit [Salinirubellus salinus]|uniref:DNA polymerase II small subunit n=1 Tax=Salinirubellus salinus TaxID=1364945 RepID=A0A9E7U3H2_9EURY|nr:DNA-directed DNA polymerase II small subunit [Salinirubellus salinus]UWM53250.1 DNA-directed DNA polymerase II small subunit [Salinirubellus salinus]
MPLEEAATVARRLASLGFNAEREAVTLLARASETEAALLAVVESVPEDAVKITADHVRRVLDDDPVPDPPAVGNDDTSVSTGTENTQESYTATESAAETEGSVDRSSDGPTDAAPTPDPSATAETTGTTGATNGGAAAAESVRNTDRSKRSVEVAGDMTGRSTGTGEYKDFVATFRDRYERLSGTLKGRVKHRPARSLQQDPGGTDAGMVGMVADISSTSGGHWIIDLEDTTGVFPCLVMKDKPAAELVDEILLDEVIAVSGSLSEKSGDDRGILFVDAIHFPDVPHTFQPKTADRHVRAALISDVHVGSQEFMADAWERFADWLHTEDAAEVEYLLIAGDMVEGIGVYPNQDEELDVIDIYDQYELFAEHLKSVPGDVEIVMIPGNHDAVRLAEPQPAFDEELRDIMSAHDARIVSNPSTVTVEGVSVHMYHGVSLDEVIAELPAEKASYDEPHKAMYQLLKKRHVAPQFGGRTRLAPEERDYLVMEEVPAIFHTGHVHKLGYGKYRNVLAVNSGCWQEQTGFQQSVGIEPDHAYAPVVDLDTLDLTVYNFN